jgi:hypothetical protein
MPDVCVPLSNTEDLGHGENGRRTRKNAEEENWLKGQAD